jgi:hypothetical protein
MVQRALRVTGKTRSAHETAMNEVADAVKRLFASWGLIDEGSARSPWCIDDAFEALGGKTLTGHRVLIFEAALEVWTSYCSAQGPRESMIDQFATLVDATDGLKAVRNNNAISTYLGNISRFGSKLGMHFEPRTDRSQGLDSRIDSLLLRLETLRAEAEELADSLAERRQRGLAIALYGPRGAGPRVHFAYALRLADFSDRQIALIRGDVPRRRERTDREAWQHAWEAAAKLVYLELYRLEQKLAEAKAK